MRGYGFEPLLSHNLQAPIIVTFRMPADPRFDFQDFYDRLKEKGFVIYPGKLTVADMIEETSSILSDKTDLDYTPQELDTTLVVARLKEWRSWA